MPERDTAARTPAPPQTKISPADTDPILYCPVCSTRLGEHRCKLVCEKCGYYLSCSDYC